MSASIVRRVIAHVKAQNWFAVTVDFLIVVMGVFVGIQASNWNEARIEALHRQQIIDALVTNLNDTVAVQNYFVTDIGTGLSTWQKAYQHGEKPAPFYFRIEGSDTAPDVWSTFEHMQLTDLFDPATVFDLAFFYSEQSGVGRKYLRYVEFVENRVLPQLTNGTNGFYDEHSHLKPEFRANMDRLRDFEHENMRLTKWANCLIYRLEAHETFTQTCSRSNFRLPGMMAGRGDRSDLSSHPAR